LSSEDHKRLFEVLRESDKFVGKGPAGILTSKLSNHDFEKSKTYLSCNQQGRLVTLHIKDYYLTIVMVEKDKDGQYPAAYDDIINSRSTFIFDMGDMPGLLLEKNPNVCRKINDVWIIKSWQLSCERGPDVRR
jgi:hypothetical protein